MRPSKFFFNIPNFGRVVLVLQLKYSSGWIDYSHIVQTKLDYVHEKTNEVGTAYTLELVAPFRKVKMEIRLLPKNLYLQSLA